MKIAIIGSGISGLYAAWKLSAQHQVTIFEKNSYFGGHTDTHHFQIEGQTLAVDSGFIVFNDFNYPLFSEMLAQLGVEKQSSDMSFSVNNVVTGLQYNPSKKWSLLKRPQNFLNQKFRRMLLDLYRFYQENKDQSVMDCDAELTIESYLNQHHYSEEFRHEHLYPMCGALWSTPVDQVGQIPYKFVVSFFQHHRMLQLKARPQWQTVKNGSNRYIHAIRQHCPSIQWKHLGVHSVSRHSDRVEVQTDAGLHNFDWVVFASHADDTLQLLEDATDLEREILQNFDYQNNHMVVHHDSSIMPRQRSQWASWHVHVTADEEAGVDLAITQYSFSYWMNNLQNLQCKSQIFATLNPNMKIDPAKILVQRHYRHPVFDQKAIQAQARWQELQGLNRTAYCGAYWGWGFHEDGARSAARVVDYLAKLS